MVGARNASSLGTHLAKQLAAELGAAGYTVVSGLACGVVVDAAAKSGGLITARTALDQSREVMAVPGRHFDARTYGCNMLIRDGATLIRNAEDIIETLGPVETQTTLELPLGMPQTPKRSLR